MPQSDQITTVVTGPVPGPGAEDAPPVVPGYVVERELGRGGSSRVWLVHPVAGGAPLALKVPDGEVETGIHQLDHELRAIGELQHDHLVSPRGVVETDQGPGLLSDYCPGGSLGALVRSVGPLPLGQVVTTLVPLAQALGELHARGVVHGDVAPGNVLYGVDGRPGLADLGCARLLGGSARRGGTPGFLAPEVVDDLPGAAADVYALAAVGWYALTGRAPSSTSTRAPLTLTLPEIPRDVVALLESGLDECPEARPTAAQFATACYAWSTPEPVDLHGAAHPTVAVELPTRRPPVGATQRARTGITTRRVLFAVVCASILAALGSGVAQIRADSESDNVTAPAAQPPEDMTPTSPPADTTSSAIPPPVEGTNLPAGLASDDPVATAEALGPARTEALVERDLARVRSYAVDGSEAHRQDAALVKQLVAEDLRFTGLTMKVDPKGPPIPTGSVQAGQTTVRVPAEVSISPYRTRAGTEQTTVDTQDRLTSERVELEMVRTPEGWRLNRVLAVGA